MAQPRRHVQRILMLTALLCSLLWVGWAQLPPHSSRPTAQPPAHTALVSPALQALAVLPIKEHASMDGYSRAAFGSGWATDHGCDTRERILARDLTSIAYKSADNCIVLSGLLHDPYTGRDISFIRGGSTSNAVQIDHVVALGDAWQTGAQALTPGERIRLYNDPLELLAVDGPTNEQKGDGDAATWLPPNVAFRCSYVARQIAVKQTYHLWVTQAEHDAIQHELDKCPTQALPTGTAQ